MSKVPSITGGGTTDPNDCRQFKIARDYVSVGNGVSSISSSTSDLVVSAPTGDVVLQYNGIHSVASGDGISVAENTPGVATVTNTGVRTISTNTPGILRITNAGGPTGTGDIAIDYIGSGGGGGTVPLESFQVALSADITRTNSQTWIPVAPLTDTVDTGTFPGIDTSSLFNDMTSGTLDLVTGVFTVGTSGYYLVSFQCTEGGGTVIAPFIDDDKLLMANLASNGSEDLIVRTVYLNAGQTVRLKLYDTTFDPGDYSKTDYGFIYYTTLFGMSLIRSQGAPESFHAAVATDLPLPGIGIPGVWAPTYGHTTTVNTATFPTIDPSSLYNNLTAGTYDNATGVFTVGVSGVYHVTYTAQYPDLPQITLCIPVVDGTKYLQSALNGVETPSLNLYLAAGQTLQLYYLYQWDGGNPVPYLYTDPITNETSYSAHWGATLLDYRAVGSGTLESFRAALSQDLVLSNTGTWIDVVPTTTTVDTVNLPDVDTRMLYNNLTTGVYNETTGVFTAGVTGIYMITWVFASSRGGNIVPYIDGNAMILNMYLNGDGTEARFVKLTAGQTVKLRTFDDTTNDLEYIETIQPGSLGDFYTVHWGVTLIDALNPNGSGVATAPEAFSATLAADQAIGNLNNAWTNLTNLTTTLNTVAFPTFPVNSLYNNLTSGVLDVAAGTFTPGVSGQYMFTISNRSVDTTAPGVQTSVGLRVGSDIYRDPVTSYGKFTAMLDLTAGDLVELVAWNRGNTLPYVVSDYVVAGNVPQIIWAGFLINGVGTGGGGGGSGVQSVTAGDAYISVDNTDPLNPTISNDGVRTVTQGTGISITGGAHTPTVANAGVTQIIAGTGGISISPGGGTGAVTISYTGGGGGGGGGGSSGIQGFLLGTPNGSTDPNNPMLGLFANLSAGNVVTLTNTSVLRVSPGFGISVSGDQTNRTVSVGNLGSGSDYSYFDTTYGYLYMAGLARPWFKKDVNMVYYNTADLTQQPSGHEIYSPSFSFFPSFDPGVSIAGPQTLTGFFSIPLETATVNVSPGVYRTSIYFSFSWMPSSAAAGTVRWKLGLKLIRPGDNIDTTATYDYYPVAQATPLVRNTLVSSGYVGPVVCNFSTTYPPPGSIIAVWITRDLTAATPADTYPGKALFCGLEATYQIGQLGQRFFNAL